MYIGPSQTICWASSESQAVPLLILCIVKYYKLSVYVSNVNKKLDPLHHMCKISWNPQKSKHFQETIQYSLHEIL